MQLYFLGTGAGSPSAQRNVSATLLDLQQERGGVWLFDCGEASQHQMLRGPYSPRRLEKIFISHLHGDHLFGLPGMIDTRSMQGADTPLTVYGPPGLREYIEVSLRVSYSHLIYPLEIVEIAQPGVVFNDQTFSVECRPLSHVVPCLGYRIVEHDRPAAIDARALSAAGIAPGPLYARLKNGEVTVLDDGRQIDGKDYLLPPKPGRVVTILGDTAFCQASVELARNANVLVHEATFANADALPAEKYGHSRTVDAAQVAAQAEVKQLILNHLSARYRPESLPDLLAEAQSVFAATSMAHDLMAFEVRLSE